MSFSGASLEKANVQASREASFFEKYTIARELCDEMNRGFYCSVKYNRPVNDTLLSHALRNVILEFPIFSLNMFRTSGKPTWDDDARMSGKNWEARPVHSIRYSDLVEWRPVESFDDDVLRALSLESIPVNVEVPSWRVFVYTEKSGAQYVTFACNHVFFDGRSGAHFLQDLTRYLDQATRETPKFPLRVLYTRERDFVAPVPPASDSVTTLFNTTLWFTIKMLVAIFVLPSAVKRFFGSYFNSEVPNLYKNPRLNLVHRPESIESGMKCVRLSPDELAQVLARCKQLKVSLTPYIASCFYKAVEETFTPYAGPFSQEILLIMCGRRYFPQQEREMRYGLNVSFDSHYIRPGTSISAASKFLFKKLAEAISSRAPFQTVGLLNSGANIWAYVRQVVESERETFDVSNLGAFPIAHGDWEAEDLVFSQGVTSTHFSVSVVSSQGGLAVTLAFHESLYDYVTDGVTAPERCAAKFRGNLMRRRHGSITGEKMAKFAS